MGEFFGSIYCWFEEMFGEDLANYLWGQASPEQISNLFITIGLITFGVSFIFAIVYYYVLNHPRWNHWWGWLIFLVLNAVSNFIIGWQFVLSDYDAGKMYKIDQATSCKINLQIEGINCLQFGVANLLISIIFFFFISYIIKWGSSNCGRTPHFCKYF